MFSLFVMLALYRMKRGNPITIYISEPFQKLLDRKRKKEEN